jgi:hypothetical protein
VVAIVGDHKNKAGGQHGDVKIVHSFRVFGFQKSILWP